MFWPGRGGGGGDGGGGGEGEGREAEEDEGQVRIVVDYCIGYVCEVMWCLFPTSKVIPETPYRPSLLLLSCFSFAYSLVYLGRRHK